MYRSATRNRSIKPCHTASHSAPRPSTKIQQRQKRSHLTTPCTKSLYNNHYRSVSMVSADFKVVTVHVHDSIPQTHALLPGSSNQQTDNTTSNNSNNTQLSSTQFIPSSIFSDTTTFNAYAQNNPNKVMLVKKSDLMSFYNKNMNNSNNSNNSNNNILSLNGNNNALSQNSLLGRLIPSSSTTATTESISDPSHKLMPGDLSHNHNKQTSSSSSSSSMTSLQLSDSPHHIVSIINNAPSTTLNSISNDHNTQRRQYFNSTPAKVLPEYTIPKQPELDIILSSSLGNINNIKQIIFSSYYIAMDKMGLLPQQFLQWKDNMPHTVDDMVSYAKANNNTSSTKSIRKRFTTIDDDNDNDSSSNDTSSSSSYIYNIFSHDKLEQFEYYITHELNENTRSLIRQSSLYAININSQLIKGGSALHHAASLNNIPLLQFIIYHGGNINILSANGSTPLHWAAGNGAYDAVKVLCDVYNADYNISTSTWCVDVFGKSSGQYPIHWAAASGYDNIISYLHNKNPLLLGYIDEKDNIPLSLAQKGLHFSTSRYIKTVLSDEYIPISFNVHTQQHTITVDPYQMRQQQQQQQQQQSQHVTTTTATTTTPTTQTINQASNAIIHSSSDDDNTDNLIFNHFTQAAPVM